MVNDFLQLLPSEPGTAALATAMLGTLLGAALWLMGTKFSRPLVTLSTVLIGAVVGMHLPGWCGWGVSGAGPAVAGALMLGVSGYVLHRMWMGIGLGSVLALWTAFAVWALMHDGRPWSWPAYERSMLLFGYLKLVWQAVPTDIARVMPFCCAAALVSGIAAAILWPKLTTVLNWSTTGTSLLACTGIAAMAYGKPAWLQHLPPQAWAQAAALGAMVAIGAAVQWKLSPAPAGPAPAGAAKSKPPGKKKLPAEG